MNRPRARASSLVKRRLPVLVVVGTRPEAVKLAPVVHQLRASPTLRPILLATSQHTQLLHPVLAEFGLKADHDLRVMRRGQDLSALSRRLIGRLTTFLAEHPVAAVVVQGDTTTALMGGLCAFYQGTPVAHVEAGLRTGDLGAPFPEELNRRLLATLARWHFAPTASAVHNLRQEGVPSARIVRTGNTVVDALLWMLPRCRSELVSPLRPSGAARPFRQLVLVTCHRRENLGRPLQVIVRALGKLARQRPDLDVLFPVHPNPGVGQVVRPALRHLANVSLLPPLEYRQFLACLREADLVVTDSGGVQEEATVLGKRVVVLREQTERTEGVEEGWLTLAGTDAAAIVRACADALDHPARPARRASRVFGDGRAAERIVRVLERDLAR